MLTSFQTISSINYGEMNSTELWLEQRHIEVSLFGWELVYVRVNAIIITKMLVFLLCKFWTTCTALGVIFYEFINHSN
jgi:hypothetical protein